MPRDRLSVEEHAPAIGRSAFPTTVAAASSSRSRSVRADRRWCRARRSATRRRRRAARRCRTRTRPSRRPGGVRHHAVFATCPAPTRCTPCQTPSDTDDRRRAPSSRIARPARRTPGAAARETAGCSSRRCDTRRSRRTDRRRGASKSPSMSIDSVRPSQLRSSRSARDVTITASAPDATHSRKRSRVDAPNSGSTAVRPRGAQMRLGPLAMLGEQDVAEHHVRDAVRRHFVERGRERRVVGRPGAAAGDLPQSQPLRLRRHDVRAQPVRSAARALFVEHRDHRHDVEERRARGEAPRSCPCRRSTRSRRAACSITSDADGDSGAHGARQRREPRRRRELRVERVFEVDVRTKPWMDLVGAAARRTSDTPDPYPCSAAASSSRRTRRSGTCCRPACRRSSRRARPAPSGPRTRPPGFRNSPAAGTAASPTSGAY